MVFCCFFIVLDRGLRDDDCTMYIMGGAGDGVEC